jgi:hypothetical protein
MKNTRKLNIMYEQDRQFTHYVTLRRFSVAVVSVENK